VFIVSTALIHAVRQKQAAVCAYLVEKGADLTATDNDGQYSYKLLTQKFY
jgi:ankyrin repeat protein